MPKSNKRREIHIGDKHEVIIQPAHYVIINDHITLFLGSGPSDYVLLPIEIKADFNNIPEEYHETFIQIMSAKYAGSIRYTDGERPFQKPFKVRRRWYHFLKLFK